MTIFVWKLSGSHFNPAVTLAFMIRGNYSGNKLPFGLGIAYIVVQVLGGYVGALIVNFYTLDIDVLEYNDSFIMRALVQELISTWIYVLFFLSVTDK